MNFIRSSRPTEQSAKKVLALLRAKKCLLQTPNKTVTYYIDSPPAAKKDFPKKLQKHGQCAAGH